MPGRRRTGSRPVRTSISEAVYVWLIRLRGSSVAERRAGAARSYHLTALLMELRLFQTGSIPSPASRFLCEHLLQNLIWACFSRIHAQVPVVTTGQLAKTFRQQIPCGIDVAIVAD